MRAPGDLLGRFANTHPAARPEPTTSRALIAWTEFNCVD